MSTTRSATLFAALRAERSTEKIRSRPVMVPRRPPLQERQERSPTRSRTGGRRRWPHARPLPGLRRRTPRRRPAGPCPCCLLRLGLDDPGLGLSRGGPRGHDRPRWRHGGGRRPGDAGRDPRPDLRGSCSATPTAGPEPVLRPGSRRRSRAPGRPRGRAPAPRRDRPRRHGGRAQGPRRRPGPRPGRQGPAGAAPRQPRAGPPVRRGGADRRPAAAPRDRAGLRAGRLRRPPALLHHEAGQGPHPGRAAAATAPGRATTCRGSWRSSSRSARRWPTPTPGG